MGIVDTFTARRYAQQLQVVKIQGALPFEVQLLMTASHAADPAVLLMRSIIRRRLEQWVDAQAADRGRRGDYCQKSSNTVTGGWRLCSVR
ncbi:hypothetical protein [Candidatus Sodalis pierantonius]|uniref:hypothetical protein n=1 Tax=Candidatus Sodalis pierantonii TaxID=1486991 RepID=UPI00046D0EB7|nr:hypothetical protein [Candidatus Sodalis pierantonius]